MKVAKTIPLPKVTAPLSFDDFRPISILPSLSKVFEKILFQRFVSFFDSCNIFTKFQYGFRKQKSTVQAVANVVERIRARMNTKQPSVACCLDLRKAFDTIDRQRLLKKLEKYGIRGNILNLVNSYLSNRYQYVEYNGIKSKCKMIKYGVPQGSVLGPLFFIIYINDLPILCKHCSVVLFADDTCLVGDCRQQSAEGLQSDLISVTTWLDENRLVLNDKKSVAIGFGTSFQEIKFLDFKIDIKNSLKYLGIHIDGTLSFKYHISEIKKDLIKCCSIFYRIRRIFHRKHLIQIYNAIVRSKLQYGILVYGCTSKTNLEPLMMLQKRILRIIFFRKKFESITSIMTDFKIPNVCEMHIHELFKELTKIKIKKSDLDINLEPPNTNRPTRATVKGLVKLPLAKNTLQKNSINYRITKLYNMLLEAKVISASDIVASLQNERMKLKLIKNFLDVYLIGNPDFVNSIFV